MAGSYEHVTKNDGSFIGGRVERSDVGFTDMIENLGDAHEACEHMHWMIHYLAGGDQTKIREASGAYYLNRKVPRTTPPVSIEAELRKALQPLADEDCESYCLSGMDEPHDCAPANARAALKRKP